MTVDVHSIKDRVAAQSETLHRLRAELGKVLVGQEHLVSRLLVALISDGHVLLEGVPGLAKTLAIKSLAATLETQFQRIQFTPDLLPADLLGTLIYNPQEARFETRQGPIFANFILADEINRAPAKVQSALLEAMQERQVSLGDTTYPLPNPFLVMATQNPIEQEGTYPLPEAQVDRFMLKVRVDYPQPAEERRIMDMALENGFGEVKAVTTTEQIFQMREVAAMIYVDENVREYIVNLIQATRNPARFHLEALEPLLEFGASPRATISLGLAARAYAFLTGRGFVTPQDVKDMALDVLRHRIILSYEAEAEQKDADDVLRTILDTVPVP
ncbi:MAG: MoxR family ATPase [Planctomycetota bacterium]|nr:MAG: MoxR family ATPase [Planctomycetota bacterium]